MISKGLKSISLHTYHLITNLTVHLSVLGTTGISVEKNVSNYLASSPSPENTHYNNLKFEIVSLQASENGEINGKKASYQVKTDV